MKNYFVCKKSNELYNLIKNKKENCYRYDNLKQTILNIEPKSNLYIFEDIYPQKTHIIDKEILDVLKNKNIKVFIEYPKKVYGLKQEDVIKVDRERIVDIKTTKLGQNNCNFVIPYNIEKKHIIYTYAKVAGYKNAVYGLPKKHIPYIISHPSYSNVLISSSKISSPITSRFKPINFWNEFYNNLFNIDIVYEEDVKPTFSKEYVVKKEDIKNARNRSLTWFKKNMLLKDNYGMKVYEGYSSSVNSDGSQKLAQAVRNDCTGEASLVFSMDYAINSNIENKEISNELIKYIFQDLNQLLDMEKDKAGFVKWYGQGDDIYYTDDNARLLLGVLPSIGILDTGEFNEGIIKCIFAYLRSISEKGIHMDSLRTDYCMNVKDWTYKDIKTKKEVKYSPHYVSYIWVAFLLMYGITKDEELLEVSKKGIYNMMDKYPHKWKWTNGIMAEISRMILPLAMLYRYDKNDTTKKFLDMMIEEVKTQTNKVGCMIEKMILIENGKYPPTKCNEDYGKYEAPIIHENGDLACDLLYSQNFAYLGLYEAYMVTKDDEYKKLVNQMTSFFVKIQTTSTKHNNLDGVWMRSFDPSMWEYWGSGADAGWAALCVESGWTNSWINIVFALKEENKSITDYIKDVDGLKKMYYDIKDKL